MRSADRPFLPPDLGPPLTECRPVGRDADHRQTQPLLPFLVNHGETRYDRARLLLERADKAAEGEVFTHEGTEYRRVRTEADRKLLRHGDEVPTRVQEVASGRIFHIGTDEEAAFWEWATVETLRHSGVRIEELCELTHLSIPYGTPCQHEHACLSEPVQLDAELVRKVASPRKVVVK